MPGSSFGVQTNNVWLPITERNDHKFPSPLITGGRGRNLWQPTISKETVRERQSTDSQVLPQTWKFLPDTLYNIQKLASETP